MFEHPSGLTDSNIRGIEMACPEFSTFSLPQEKWKPVPEFSDYFISNFGRLYSVRKKPRRLLKLSPDSHGYLHAHLYGIDRKKVVLIHRLVAKAFLGTPPAADATVNHKDAIKTNNHVKNLEWCSNADNFQHAVKLGLVSHGMDHYLSKLNDESVRDVRFYLRNGFSERKIAKMFGVTRNVINNIRHGKTWKHVH